MTEKIALGEGVEVHKPRQVVLDALKYVLGGSVLDFGSGFRRHSLFLATKGFAVTSVELDEQMLVALKAKAEKLNVTIKTVQDDIRNFDPSGQEYDLILSTMVLHFLSNHEEVVAVVRKMQDATKLRGINVICSYTDKSQAGLRPYLMNVDTLRELYAKWEILHFAEHQGTDSEIDGPDKGKLIWRVEMIARKND